MKRKKYVIEGRYNMLDVTKAKELMNKYPECKEVFELQDSWENNDAFKKLASLKGQIPSELYGMILFRLYITDTEGVEMDSLIQAFIDVKRENLMTDEELTAFNNLPEVLTIYRGSENPNEKSPRMSWSLSKSVAEGFARAHLFASTISKDEVIAYFLGDEEEIVALVGDNYETIY